MHRHHNDKIETLNIITSIYYNPQSQQVPITVKEAKIPMVSFGQIFGVPESVTLIMQQALALYLIYPHLSSGTVCLKVSCIYQAKHFCTVILPNILVEFMKWCLKNQQYLLYR